MRSHHISSFLVCFHTSSSCADGPQVIFWINHRTTLKALGGAFAVVFLAWIWVAFFWLPESRAFAALRSEIVQTEAVQASVGKVTSVRVLPFGFSIAYNGTSLVIEVRVRIEGERGRIDAVALVSERDGLTKVERIDLGD